jgi:hypothetical protein
MPSEDPEDTEDDLWADSADRKITIRALAEHRDEKHLSSVEHDRRRDLARQARTRGELRALFADLPAPHPLIGEEPAAGGTWVARLAQAGNGAGLILSTGAVVVLLALLAGWWVPALIFACLLVVATVFVTVGGR